SETADHLFAAMATDTGWFRHSNTKPVTYELAAALIRAGAKPTRLYELIYEKSTLPRKLLEGLMLSRIRLEENGQVCLSEVRVADYAATGAIPSDTEDMINHLRSIAGVEVAMLFLEQPAGGIKVSFRSHEKIDVNKIASQFGGGGHRLASGATLQTTLASAEARVLAAVKQVLAP